MQLSKNKTLKLFVFMVMTAALLSTGNMASAARNGEVIPPREFYADTTLTVLTIEPEITEIGNMAFADCPNLAEVVFAEGSQLEKIGSYAFMGCRNLKRIILPDKLKHLGEGCLSETGIEILFVPDSVKEIPKYLCHKCTELRKVSLPDDIPKIGMHAFSYCPALGYFTFPPYLENIGMNAFVFSGLVEAWIPDTVTELESYAFAECTRLRRVKLPGNSKMLGELIFSGCTSLEEIIEPAVLPPPFDCNSFIAEPDWHEFYEKCALRVPASAIAKYSTAQGWRLFHTIQ